AARRRADPRRGAADRETRARDLAEPALGRLDRLHHVVARRADGAARPQGKLYRGGTAVGPALVRGDRDFEWTERTDAVRRGAQRADHAGRTIGRDLSARHRGAERDHAQAHRDHAAHRRWNRADRRRRCAGADRLKKRFRAKWYSPLTTRYSLFANLNSR